MNFIERIVYGMGKARGSFNKGLNDAFHTSGTRPSLSDESAWRDPYEWGSYLLDGKKPSSKIDFINSNEGWVYKALCGKGVER